MEYQINDRMSFMRFLDLKIADDVPDSLTVWAFREKITNEDLVEKIFELFLSQLERLGLIVNEGKIIDASFVEVPRQRNKREDNKEIKSSKIPESISKSPNRKAQKDTDARWTKKNYINYFGYKNHIKTDAKSKVITRWKITNASVHDSQVLDSLLDEKDKGENFYADSAYTGEEPEKTISKKEMINQVCEKGYRNNPLTEEQKAFNKEKSRTRSRVEHIFGFMENSMNGMFVQNIGQKRIAAVIELMNLTYNMHRKIQLTAI